MDCLQVPEIPYYNTDALIKISKGSSNQLKLSKRKRGPAQGLRSPATALKSYNKVLLGNARPCGAAFGTWHVDHHTDFGSATGLTASESCIFLSRCISTSS